VGRLALAYLFRRPVQALAVLGVAIGLAALLVVLAVMNGLIQRDREGVRGPLSDLLLLPAVTGTPPEYETYRKALEARPEISATAPHLVAYAVLGLSYGSGLLSQTRSSDVNGVQLVGIDPQAEARASGFLSSLEHARLHPPPDLRHPFRLPAEETGAGDALFSRPPILVSDSLAGSLGLRPGERIQFGALPPTLPPEGQPLEPHNAVFQVAATYATQDYSLDMNRIYLPRTGRNGLRYNLLGSAVGDFSEILIKLRPGIPLEAGRKAVRQGLKRAGLPLPGGEQGGSLQTWQERRQLFLSAIENERRVTGLVLFFIVIVAGFGLFATLSALVREKIRDLGILAALGYTPLRRAALLFFVGSLASGLGALIGYGSAWWIVARREWVEAFLRERLGIVIFNPDIYVVQGLPALWISRQALTFTLAAFGIGLLFTLVPALRAASFSPTRALRYE